MSLRNGVRYLPKLNSQYVYLRPLGSGSFADVFLIRAKGSKKLCVIKVYRRSYDKRKVIYEYESLCCLVKSGLLSMCDIFTFGSDYSWSLVYDYAAGSTLDTFMNQKWTEDEFLDLIKALLSEVRRYQSLGYVHRDLKPDNIVYHQGKCQFIDFQSIQHVNWPYNNGAGTPLYTSPEKLVGLHNYFPPKILYLNDIYAIGVTLYRLWFKRDPFLRKREREEDIGDLALFVAKMEFNQVPNNRIEALILYMMLPNYTQRPDIVQLFELLGL